MRRFALALLLLAVPAATVHTQDALTRNQRIEDLTQLAGFYAKNYAPYEWKRDTFQFDLMRLTPWLQKVHHAGDLEFHEALIEYVASLNDAHDFIAFPTTFSASLPMAVDIYDGKVLIEALSTTVFPGAARGDELVSIDGVPVATQIAEFKKYAIAANPRSTDRTAAARLVSRSQQIMPHVSSLGANALVAIKLAATGTTNTYVVPWTKVGIPVNSQGPVPSPRRGNGRLLTAAEAQSLAAGAAPGASAGGMFQIADLGAGDSTLPSYMDSIRPLLNVSVSKDYYSVSGIGSRFPVWAPPAGFVIRPVPTGTPAFLLSGTYMADGLRIGYLRIPSMSPPSTALILQHLDQEIAFFNANTDALVVDVMRNPGGLVSFVESISQRFMPGPFQTIGFEIRATAAWLFSFAAQLTNARLTPSTPPQVLANLEANFNEVLSAYNENRGRSAPVSLNATGSLTLDPTPVVYSKPMIVLIDEFSASGGDMFPAIIQSNRRAPLFGTRTMGAGGSVVGFNAPAYTESFFRITVSLMNRGHIVQTPDYPPAPYIENIGVRPDIPVDYMTRTNLMGNGASFVQAFTDAIVRHARGTTP